MNWPDSSNVSECNFNLIHLKLKKFIYLFLLFLSFHSFGQERVTPLQGEGVHALLRRNGRAGNEYFQKFVELNREQLGVNNRLKLGVSYVLPPLSNNETSARVQTKNREPLFGKRWADYTIESDQLKGACFYLESGHGGIDPGAITRVDGHKLHEDEYAYDIMLRLALNLLKNGATVHIILQDPNDGIRDDVYLANTDRETFMGEAIHPGYTNKDQQLRLKQKSDIINRLSSRAKEKYQRAVYIHLDSRKATLEPIDIFFYYWKGSVKGKQLADNLLNTIRAEYKEHQPNRSFTGKTIDRNLHALRETIPVGAYAELGNIWNNRDRQRFLNPNNRQAIANWLYVGLVKDYEDFKKNR